MYDDAFTKDMVTFRKVPRKNLSVRQKYAVFFKDRDKAYDQMLHDGVECQKHYRDNFGTGALAKNKITQHANTTFYNNSSLSIPMHSFLHDNEVEKVISTVKKYKNV
jgi:dTDP-4-amino-4,6-dideoxygalactose transaminase